MLAAWSVGIMAAILLSPLMPWLVLGGVLAACVALVNRALALVAALCFAAALTGAGRGALAATVELPPGLAGQVVAISGSVDDDPVDHKASHRVTVRLDHMLIGGGEIRSGVRIEAVVYGMTPIHYGDLVLLSGELQEPPRFDLFDYRAYLAEQGIAGVMPSARLVRVTSHAGDPLHTMLFALRHAVIDAVDRALPEPQAALLLGVVFGYRAPLPPLLQQRMIASGLTHRQICPNQRSVLNRVVHRRHASGAEAGSVALDLLDATRGREYPSREQFFGFRVPVLRANRRNAKLAGAHEFVDPATTQAEVSCGVADLKYIGSSDSLLAIPTDLFDDILGPTVFLQLAKDLLPFIIGELGPSIWDDRLWHDASSAAHFDNNLTTTPATATSATEGGPKQLAAFDPAPRWRGAARSERGPAAGGEGIVPDQ